MFIPLTFASMESASLLKRHGLRSTPVRRLLLEIMDATEHAVSHADLEQQVGGEADRVTLYRALNTFEEHGIIHKVLDREGVARFALCMDNCSTHTHVDEHLHFQCTVCSNVYCLPIEHYPRVSMPNGFNLVRLSLVAEGVCKRCN